MIPASHEGLAPLSGFAGFHRGRVEAVDDPLKMGRARVRVMPMFEEIRTADLPWAHPAWPLGPSGQDQGYFDVPPVGSVVWCFFENADPMQPVYWAVSAGAKNDGQLPLTPEEARKLSGSAHSNKNASRAQNVAKAAGGTWSEPSPVSPETSTYPLNRVLKTGAGHLIELDDTPGKRRLNVYHPAGSWIEVHEDGTTVIHAKGDLVHVTLKDEKVSVAENFDLTAGSAAGIKAPSVTITASTVNLGGLNGQKTAMGEDLKSYLEQLVSYISTQMILQTPVGPTMPGSSVGGVPVPTVPINLLSDVVKSIRS